MMQALRPSVRAPTNEMPISDQDYRRALGRFPTGVGVLAAQMKIGVPAGLTINSFTSVSLSPRLVAWCLNRHKPSAAQFIDCSYVTINVLAAAQAELAMRFAGPERMRFDDLDWKPGLGGSPVLSGACASFEIQVASRQEVGDHVICVGQVVRFCQSTRPALMFVVGEFIPLQN